MDTAEHGHDKGGKRRKGLPSHEGESEEQKDNNEYCAAEASTGDKIETEDEQLSGGGNDQQQDYNEASQGRNLMHSEAEAHIQEIRQGVELYTQQVSGFLEAVKNYFVEASNAFEERVVQLHQTQIEKWEEEIRMLGLIHSENEEMSYRLSNAQKLLSHML